MVKNQQTNFQNFILYTLIFILSIITLGFFYFQNTKPNTNDETNKKIKKLNTIVKENVEKLNNYDEIIKENVEKINSHNETIKTIQATNEKQIQDINKSFNSVINQVKTAKEEFKNKTDSNPTIVNLTPTNDNSRYKPTKAGDCPSFDNLIGMNEPKKIVKPFLHYLKDKSEFENRGKVQMSDGLLMHGIAGTGKTVFARSVAKEAGLPFIEVSCADFSQPYKGEAVSMVKDLFNSARTEAKKSQGCVIFLDECETIFLNISTLRPDSEIRNVVNEYKVQLENHKDREHPLFIIGATNNLRDIDPAILSRFSNKLEIKPEDFDGRKEQLKFILEKTHKFPITAGAKDYLLNTINKSLDLLPKNEDFKKAYRVLLNFMNNANELSIQRTIEAKQNNEVCTDVKHKNLSKNHDIIAENNKNKQPIDPNILSNCCPCKAITIKDLQSAYTTNIAPLYLLSQAEQYY